MQWLIRWNQRSSSSRAHRGGGGAATAARLVIDGFTVVINYASNAGRVHVRCG